MKRSSEVGQGSRASIDDINVTKRVNTKQAFQYAAENS
jgi:hypothetical protein